MNIEEQSNDRLLHAKNLLKKFQSKNQRNNDFDPLINSTNGLEINMDINNSYILNNSSSSSPLLLQNFSKSSSETKTLNEENSMNGPGNSSASEHLLPINQLEGNHVRCYSVPENMRIDETELNGSRSLLVQKEQELTIALSKLNLLHKSYSELYTAYNQLIEKNDAKDGRETPVHVNNQIQQLQIALTHSLEEKTALQNELRDVKSKMEELKNSEIFKIKEKEMPQKNDFSDFSDLRLASIQQEKEELLITVNNLSQQIENERTLSSNLEAKLFMAQQDKMDTQAHLKSIYQEKVQLELKFEKCKQELAMRDIYLQQLSKQFNFEHLTENSNFGGKNDEKDDKISQEEFSSIKLELENSRKHVQTLQEQLQINSLQANSRLQKVEEELEKSKARFNEVCSLKDFLEESLRIAHETIEKNDLKNKNTLNEAVETEQNSTEIDSLKTQISTLIKEKVELINLNKEELNKLNEEKNLQIEELKNELNEAMERICEFERNKILKENIEQDASVLSIQLQNEKATVSRAISQNIELKKQLEELQTRLVEVINSLAEKENERLTLNCTISKLKKDFDELKNEKEESQKIERGVQTEEEIKENDKNDQNFINESLNNEQNCEKIEEISDKISDPKIDKSIKLKNNEPIEPFFEENEHLKFKKVEEENNNKKEEENEENILKNTNNLQERLDQLYKENEQFRLNNSKLQYWLTALETENESIGEYVALYRFQRGNVQKRIAENEALLNEFKQQNYYLMNQISHVCSLINSFLINNESTEENSNNEDCQQKIDNLKTVVQTLEKTLLSSEHNKTFSQSLCSSSNTNNGLQIRCTGCAGCRGEMSTL